jgi:glycosyltransferase involved in cell wall biosynthesis
VSALSVSVVMPLRDAAAYVAAAIESIWAQNHGATEIIVVDDGSSDGSDVIVAALGPGITLIRQSPAGAAAARNRGLDAARGDIIAFLDADDLWPAGKLALQLDALERDPTIGLVTGRIRAFGAPIPGRTGQTAAFGEGVLGVNLGCALVRRAVFDVVGRFDAGLRISDDLDWFLRAREHGIATVALDSVTLLYRIHDTNMTRDIDRVGREAVQVMKRMLDRRRATSRR